MNMVRLQTVALHLSITVTFGLQVFVSAAPSDFVDSLPGFELFEEDVSGSDFQISSYDETKTSSEEMGSTPSLVEMLQVASSTTSSASTPSSTTALPNSCRCGLAGFGTGKIVGGTEVDDAHFWPWFATLVRNDQPSLPPRAHCGASLISSRYVISAAHCLVPMVQNGLRLFSVKLGYNDLTLPKNETHEDQLDVPIESVTFHPNFEPNAPYQFDIGVIKLARSIDRNCSYSRRIRPVCLPSEGKDDDDYENDIAITAGFGRDSVNGNQSSILRQTELNVISNEECQNHYLQLPFKGPDILESMICAWRKGSDSCTGDSGGPLFIKQKKSSTYVQIGITSWGIGCSNERFPGVYTRLDKFTNWIKSVAVDL